MWVTELFWIERRWLLIETDFSDQGFQGNSIQEILTTDKIITKTSNIGNATFWRNVAFKILRFSIFWSCSNFSQLKNEVKSGS